MEVNSYNQRIMEPRKHDTPIFLKKKHLTCFTFTRIIDGTTNYQCSKNRNDTFQAAFAHDHFITFNYKMVCTCHHVHSIKIKAKRIPTQNQKKWVNHLILNSRQNLITRVLNSNLGTTQ